MEGANKIDAKVVVKSNTADTRCSDIGNAVVGHSVTGVHIACCLVSSFLDDVISPGEPLFFSPCSLFRRRHSVARNPPLTDVRLRSYPYRPIANMYVGLSIMFPSDQSQTCRSVHHVCACAYVRVQQALATLTGCPT